METIFNDAMMIGAVISAPVGLYYGRNFFKYYLNHEIKKKWNVIYLE